MERGREAEDRVPMLDRRDPARRETATVAQPIHEVHDRRLQITREDEVSVQRVRLTRLGNGAPSGNERLRQHLTSKHATGADVAITSAIDVDVGRLEVEKLEQLENGERHVVVVRWAIGEPRILADSRSAVDPWSSRSVIRRLTPLDDNDASG